MKQEDIGTVGAVDGEEIKAIRLDTPTIEARVAHYPEELREPVVWLATFMREECARDLDILTERANQLEIDFDKTNWGKILRGLWNRSARGAELPSPIIKLEKVLNGIQSLRNDSQLKERAGKVPFVMTPTAQEIWDFIDKKRAPARVNKFGLIVGNTGTQKTATIKHFCIENNHTMCVSVEAPETPSHTQFITDLAETYGCSRQASWDRKRNTIAKSLNPLGKKVPSRKTIIVENVQRLYNERDGTNQRVFNYLQKLQDDSGCTIILTLTPVFVDKLKRGIAEGYFEQFIGRAGGEKDILTLPMYPTEEDALAIAKAFSLQHADRHVKYLESLCKEPGRVRVLFEALQEAKVKAESEKVKLTIDHVREARGED